MIPITVYDLDRFRYTVMSADGLTDGLLSHAKWSPTTLVDKAGR